MTETYWNPAARAWRADRPSGVIEFHRTLPGYRPSPLVEAPELAAELGVGRVFVKDESSRLGLPAFKILGAAHAVARALSARVGSPGRALTLDELRPALAAAPPVRLVAATDGNHGRAVAHTARLLGLPAQIWFPDGLTPEAKDAIAAEGAEVVELAIPYDDVVAAATRAAEGAGPDAVLIQDTAWPGYEQVPQWIVDGYSTLFEEADAQLAQLGVVAGADLVGVPVGVGSLAQAAVRHYRSGAGAGDGVGVLSTAPIVLSVEASAAQPIIASLNAGELVSVPTSHTVMSGLNCGTPSEIAWSVLAAGLDAAVTVDEEEAIRAVHDLEALGIDSGPCGAATLAGVRRLLADDRARSALGADATVLLLSTEGRQANPLPEEDR
ncbi:pyridoxal-phosphate dependent enzyme [Agromyces mariniharenae]|uniref:Pyridoxal-phosphate dependent enzyme n=1 Tax=Agromyces mariniharenae TaxID=2604423 RepID=A0A5S4V1U0_9MICO|nr:pyridoxal-phosphate dependent enzyme [Agromyces mariniharenae]TYL50490.1 pyridoxal-phosphate dependent enzyme [Agromyces mariniharenae]